MLAEGRAVNPGLLQGGSAPAGAGGAPGRARHRDHMMWVLVTVFRLWLSFET